MPNVNTRFTLSGEKEYQDAVQKIGSSMSVLNSEMRKVTAAYAGNAESVAALSAQNEVLSKKTEKQKEAINVLQQAVKKATEAQSAANKKFEESKDTLDANSDEYKRLAGAVEDANGKVEKWQTRLNNAEAELSKLNNQIDENNKKIEESGKGTGNLGDVVNGLTSKLGIQLPDGMKSSMNAMGSLDAQSLALAGGFAAVAAAIVKVEKAMISMTKESASFADNIITLSMQTGQSTQQLQEFAYASELIDVSVDTLQGSLTKLTNNMQDTMNGTGNAKASFEALGVSVTNADGSMRSANDVFYETIDALGQVKNDTERDAMAMDIFGRSAQDLNPLIIQGSQTLKAYADEAHNMGYVLDDEALSALGAVDDAYQRLQKTQEGVKNQLAVEFAPYLKEFYGDVTTMVKDGGKAIKDSGIVDAFGMLLETVGDILNPMSDLSNNRVPALTKALQPLAKVMALMADAAELLKGVINFGTGHISEGWGQMKHALGFGYSSGNGNNYQNLLDSYNEQQWGQSASDLSKAYEEAVASGDSSTLGITEDEWRRRYLRGNAAGTDNWAGGWTRVNENGLERIYLPSGSRIQTASETRYTSGDTYNTTVYVDHVEDLDTILRIAKNARITTRMGAK